MAAALARAYPHGQVNVQPLPSPAVYSLSRGYTLALSVTASHDGRAGLTGLKVAQNGWPWHEEHYERYARHGTVAELRAPSLGLGHADERHAYRRVLTGGAAGLYLDTEIPIHIVGGSPVVTGLAREVLEDLGLRCSAETMEGLDPAAPLAEAPAPQCLLLDADGDRAGIVWRGQWRHPYECTITDLHALAAARAQEAGNLVFDLRTPMTVLQTGRAHGFRVDFAPGGRAFNWIVAHPSYLYGAETSAHRYWHAFGGSDCAIFAGLRLLATYLRHDPPEALAWPIVEERRGYPVEALTEWLERLPVKWEATYRLNEGADASSGWRVESPNEDGWICGRLASDGRAAFAAEGVGIPVLEELSA